ncbi:LAC22 [Linum grandiflorum]
MKNTKKLYSSKPIVTVNGKIPGPTLYAREGDTVLVNVVNHVNYNVSIHWATVHGGIVILPKRGVPYLFPVPHKEVVVVLEAVINEAMKSGLTPNVSDAHIINGHPGIVSNCASQGGFTSSQQDSMQKGSIPQRQ